MAASSLGLGLGWGLLVVRSSSSLLVLVDKVFGWRGGESGFVFWKSFGCFIYILNKKGSLSSLIEQKWLRCLFLKFFRLKHVPYVRLDTKDHYYTNRDWLKRGVRNNKIHKRLYDKACVTRWPNLATSGTRRLPSIIIIDYDYAIRTDPKWNNTEKISFSFKKFVSDVSQKIFSFLRNLCVAVKRIEKISVFDM